MANKTNCMKNGVEYYRMTKIVGHKLNAAGNEVSIRKEFYGRNKKEAEGRYAAFMQRQQQGLEDKKQYFGIMADNWIYNFLANDPKLKNSSKALYINAWKRYLPKSDLYHLPLDSVTAGVLQRFYNSLNCPASSLATINKVMSRFYRYLVTEGYATHDITAALSIPQKPRNDSEEIIVWTEEELQTILHSFDKAQSGFRLRFLIVLAANTGCRISELLGLKYSDIDGDTLKISRQVVKISEFSRTEKAKCTLGIDTPKSTASFRTIPLNDFVLWELELHKIWQKQDMLQNGYRTDYIFTTDSGEFYDKRNIAHACTRYYKRIGVEPKKFHTYRHTFGTMLCKKGIPIQTASALLGHKDINMTAKYYVNVSVDEKREAVKVLSDMMQG